MPLNIGGTNITSIGVKVLNDTSPTTGYSFYVDAGIANSYPGSSTAWYDLSGNNYTATLINGPTFNTGSGGYIRFDATDDWADASPSPGLTGTGNWTMMTWFQVNGAPSNTAYGNVILDTDATGGSANMICVDWGGGFGGAQNQLLYGTRPSTGGSYTWLGGPVLTQSTWYHATVARNSSTDTKLYVNGILYATYSGNMPTATQPLVRLGRWTDGTVYSNSSIGNAQIYGRTLTAQEILQNFQSQRQRFGI